MESRDGLGRKIHLERGGLAVLTKSIAGINPSTFYVKNNVWHLYGKDRRKLRERLYIEQCAKCYYCQEYVFIEDFTLDHIIPKSKYGRSVRWNYVGACNKCNTMKADKTVNEFNLE